MGRHADSTETGQRTSCGEVQMKRLCPRQHLTLPRNLAHKLSKFLSEKGIKTLNRNFYNEFVIEFPDSDKFLSKLKANNILGGIKLDENRILVCTTEMNTEEELLHYVEAI